MQTEGHCQCKGQVWTVGTGGWQGPRAGRSGMSEGEGQEVRARKGRGRPMPVWGCRELGVGRAGACLLAAHRRPLAAVGRTGCGHSGLRSGGGGLGGLMMGIVGGGKVRGNGGG